MTAANRQHRSGFLPERRAPERVESPSTIELVRDSWYFTVKPAAGRPQDLVRPAEKENTR
jgi:hypothetical protein